MSVFLDISAALDDNLNNMAGKPPIAWENYNYEPSLGTLYARATHLPADTTQASLGDSGQDINSGIYQIDVFAEAGQGKNEAYVMADLIADQFKRGTDLTYNGRTVTIRNVSRQPAAKNADGWYQIPIEILYYSYTDART